MKDNDDKLYRSDAVTVPKLLPISKKKELISDQKLKEIMEIISKRNESSKSK